ncbi:restriction endonuclease subunit S, partial [Clostridium sp. WILCCON 0269]
MENSRKKVRLGDVCSQISRGITPKDGKKIYKESGIPFVRSQNVCHNMFDYNGLVFIEADTAEKMKTIELEQGDLLINTNVNSTLRCTLVPEDIVGGRVNQHVCIMRPKHNIIDPVFLKYYLMWEKTQDLLVS